MRKYITPVLNVTHDLQKSIGDYNFKKVTVSESGMWYSSVSLSCQTTYLHTEDDCTYTVITVPKQEDNEHNNPEYNFIFHLKKGQTIGLKMDTGLTILFFGKYLTQWQSESENMSTSNDIFINFPSYGNERLYNHLKKTINRL